MDIKEIKKRKLEFEEKLAKDIQYFELCTGVKIESIITTSTTIISAENNVSDIRLYGPVELKIIF